MIDLLRFRLFEGEDFIAFSPVDVRGRAYEAMLSPWVTSVKHARQRVVLIFGGTEHETWLGFWRLKKARLSRYSNASNPGARHLNLGRFSHSALPVLRPAFVLKVGDSRGKR